jgi:polysaccharide chain length determinant protein (PEP-CTERM system associated)
MARNQRSLSGQDYIELFRLHKWWLVLPLIVGGAIATAYSYSIPPIYRSSTLIMVERQKVPEGYIQPTVTSTVQERLNTISQQVTSRTNLERIIQQFNLYTEDFDTMDQAETLANLLMTFRQQFTNVTNMKETIAQLNPFKGNDITSVTEEATGVSIEELVNRMRKNIEVQVIGKDAFSIAYSARDPTSAMDITNTLATLFIEESLRVREEEAAETSRFLETELTGASKELEKRERELKEFKSNHMGSLPQQLDVNLRTLDHLRNDLQSTSDLLRAANESLKDIEDGTFFYKRSNIDGRPEANVKINPLLAKHDTLMEELARLRAEFNENYPDIVVVKKQITDIERALTQGSTPSGSSGPLARTDPQKLQSRTQSMKSDIESLKDKQKRITGQIKEYEKRVEDTFSSEQKLSTLTRDYEIAQNHYYKLLEKKLNAKSSENLEKWQKSERFRIIDPANLPEKPFKPDRGKMILLGSLCGGGLGAGLILFKEYRHPSFRKPEDFHGIVEAPTLVTIPRNKGGKRSAHQLIALGEPNSMIADQYRVLYTKISHLTKGEAHTVFAISSPVKGEGKTVTALNLGVVTAKDFGRRTLLIEGDFKNPMLSRYLNIKSHHGLIDVLLNNNDIHSTLVPTGHDNLSVLPAGRSLQNSSALLSSPQMKDLIAKLRELYDVILIDSPPILPLPDMNIFEEVVDNIILVVRAESTTRDALVTAMDSLATQKLVGIVLNDVRRPLPEYYRYRYRQT